MRHKAVSGIMLTLLLLIVAIGVTATPWHGVIDDPTPSQAIWVDPKNTTCLDINDILMVNVLVNITDPDGAGPATGLWGWQYCLQWDPTVLDVVEVQTHGDNVPAGDLLPGHTSVMVAYNTTTSTNHTYVVTALGGSAFTGVNSLCTYTFKVVSKCGCTLDIIEAGPKQVKLADDTAELIIRGSPPLGTIVDGMLNACLPRIIADINCDGIVDIMDVLIVGLAFGTKPGHPNWNPIADLLQDGLVNIIDLVIVGVNFGNTV